jgi:hypothetical protein
MAHIVEFRSGARDLPDTHADPERTAQIIIFPGVRRERHADPPVEELRQPCGAPADRDILELPD